MHSPVLGFVLVFIAAISGGALAVPLKKRRKFELENIYVPCTLVMMLVLPFIMAVFATPNWPEAVHAAGARTVWAGIAYGFGWGIGAILFGYGVTLAGMSVGFATIMGINTAVGSLLPFVVKSRADIFTSGGMVIVLGIAGCVAGVVICGQGGFLREQQASSGGQQRGFGKALGGLCGIWSVERLRKYWLCLYEPGRRRSPKARRESGLLHIGQLAACLLGSDRIASVVVRRIAD